LVSLRHHKHKDFVKLPKEQDELNAWNKANAGKPSAGGNKGSPGKQHNHATTKKFKSMISVIESKQNEVITAMANAQQAGISAMMGGASPFAAQVAGATAAVRSGVCTGAPVDKKLSTNVKKLRLISVFPFLRGYQKLSKSVIKP
jgi:hypothetical protein